MATIDPRAAQTLPSNLISGETIHWAGMPGTGIIFHSEDWAMIPASLLWGGFAIFWELGAPGMWGSNSGAQTTRNFMALWGVPFALIGQYIIWERFIVDAWLERRTYYALTNRRALIVPEGWSQKSRSVYLDSLPIVTFEGSGLGTIWFAAKPGMFVSRGQRNQSMGRYSIGAVAVFAEIEDADSVYRLVTELEVNLRKD